MGKHEELIKTDKTLFSEYSYRDWCDYYMSLNAELPPDKCPVKLSQNEAECYKEALEKLRKERAENPGVPINYDMPKSSWFD